MDRCANAMGTNHIIANGPIRVETKFLHSIVKKNSTQITEKDCLF